MVDGIVLVHGGLHGGSCWELTASALRTQRPDLEVLAVDLPGRESVAGDLASTTIAGNAASVVEQIDAAGLDRVLVVGHSLAGITVPAAATLLSARRLHGLVWVSCLVPAHGSSALAELPPPLGLVARTVARRRPVLAGLPRPLVHWAFGNGMTREQRAFLDRSMTPEGLGPPAERVDRSAMPRVRSTWALTLRDRTLSVRTQRRFIEHLGGVDEVVELDTCHDAMITEPDALAAIILRRCLH